MAREVIKAGKVLINSVDLTDHVTQVTLTDSADEVETTNLAGTGYRSYTVGLKTASVTCTFQVDHATSSVMDTLQPLYDSTSGTIFPVKVWPSATGTIVYTLGSAQLYEKPLWGGAVGDLATVDVTFANGGTAGITRGTA